VCFPEVISSSGTTRGEKIFRPGGLVRDALLVRVSFFPTDGLLFGITNTTAEIIRPVLRFGNILLPT